MNSNNVWFGYLQAGDKSTPVVRDESIDSGSAKMIYLYNHARGQLLQYSREIVEPKLRELNPGEVDRKALEHSFQAARQAFASTHPLADRLTPKARHQKSRPPAEEEPEFDEDADDDMFLDDADMD
ncbi:MAG: hypothetical protein G8D28_09855 [gamma proteobacterium symbiont of Phacoides pectinatus]